MEDVEQEETHRASSSHGRLPVDERDGDEIDRDNKRTPIHWVIKKKIYGQHVRAHINTDIQ